MFLAKQPLNTHLREVSMVEAAAKEKAFSTGCLSGDLLLSLLWDR